MRRARLWLPTERMNPILALDFGRARIGVAISDELQLLAHPLETIPTMERPESRIAKIVGDKKVDHVVAGVPRQMNGLPWRLFQQWNDQNRALQKSSATKKSIMSLPASRVR